MVVSSRSESGKRLSARQTEREIFKHTRCVSCVDALELKPISLRVRKLIERGFEIAKHLEATAISFEETARRIVTPTIGDAIFFSTCSMYVLFASI